MYIVASSKQTFWNFWNFFSSPNVFDLRLIESADAEPMDREGQLHSHTFKFLPNSSGGG